MARTPRNEGRQVLGFVDSKLTRKERRELQRTIETERRRASDLGEEQHSLAELNIPTTLQQHGPRATSPGAGGFRSTNRVAQINHRVSSNEAAAIYPFLAGVRQRPLGAALGKDLETEDLWAFDPWRWYEHGRIPSMGVLVMGAYRQGKSFLLKRLIALMIGMGRQAINTSDSKGEHTRLAEALGGNVFRVGAPGSTLRINPLEAGTQPASMSASLWEINTRQRRSLLLQQIAEILSGERLVAEQRSTLDWALDVAVEEAEGEPTIRQVYDILGAAVRGDRANSDLGDVSAEAKRLWHVFRRLVTGDMQGMFEDESTVHIDADASYTVFDTFSMAQRGDDALAITQAVTQSWVQSILQDKTSGRKFMIVREEGWRDMSSVAALEAQRLQQKLAGEFGICQLLVVHEGGDFAAVGSAGSRERALAEQLAKGFAVKISFAQERAQLASSAETVGLTPSQADLIGTLQKGECVIAIGQDATMVDTFATTTAWERDLFDTDAAIVDREHLEEARQNANAAQQAAPITPPPTTPLGMSRWLAAANATADADGVTDATVGEDVGGTLNEWLAAAPQTKRATVNGREET